MIVVMKSTFTIFLIIFFTLFIFSLIIDSQEYLPFNFPNRVWIEETYVEESYSSNIQLYCQEDTTISDRFYNKLYKLLIPSKNNLK